MGASQARLKGSERRVKRPCVNNREQTVVATFADIFADFVSQLSPRKTIAAKPLYCGLETTATGL